jgi:penicillin-binding protein 2
MDRSVLAKYPPGSIFKPIFSLIALQEGVSHSGRHITCNGEYVINEKKGFKQKCHAHPSATNISTAIQHSCNTYYYQLMREFIEKHGYNYPGRGLNDLSKYLVEFGLGRKLGVDYELESTGFIPTSDYYDNQYNYVRSGWKSTYILSLGIGQGELQLTTLQMANLAAILGNRGHYYIPHFVKKPTASFDPIYEEPQRVSIDDKHFDPVVWGMQKVITSGTAQNAKIPGFSSAGKTGTSQNPHGKDHSVFFAFAPAVNPKIAIAVYVENAGFGGTVAAPIASLMMENYLNDFEGIKRPLLEKSMIDLDLISNP